MAVALVTEVAAVALVDLVMALMLSDSITWHATADEVA
jgi:hypothetical protein